MTYFKFYFSTELNDSLFQQAYSLIPASLLSDPTEELLLFLNQLPCFTIYEDVELPYNILSLYIFQNNFFRLQEKPHFFSAKTAEEGDYGMISPSKLTSDGEFDKVSFLEGLGQGPQFLFSNNMDWLNRFETTHFSPTEELLLSLLEVATEKVDHLSQMVGELQFKAQVTEDSLIANKGEAQKEIDFYKKKANDLEGYFKKEMANQEQFYKGEIEKTKAWAQKNPDLNFIEKLKLFFK